MPENELEQYFDLLQENSLYPDEHLLADDKLRFGLYASIKDKTNLEDADLDYRLRKIAIDMVTADKKLSPSDILKLVLYDKLNEDYDPEELAVLLSGAMSGIIAKDKKMIEVLRQLKIGATHEIVGLAIEKSPKKKKSKSIQSILKEGKSSKTAPEKGV
ncbi:MAG: hypothetical protein K0R98_1304 [Rickettsiaceae bacterium]|jgi:hypothetical protein|nr:hypothetical protein [Rickettsiaceae bacterium]